MTSKIRVSYSAFLTALAMALAPTASGKAFAALASTPETQPTSYTNASELSQPSVTENLVASKELALTVTAATSAKTYYVTPTSNLQAAVSKLLPGDTLVLRAGTYKQYLSFTKSGTSSAYIKIKGEGTVVIDGTGKYEYTPAIDTKGFDYLSVENIKVINSRAGVQVSEGSHHVRIAGFKTDKNDFGVLMKSASYVRITNSTFANSRNAIRGEGTTHDVTVESTSMFGSKDVYAGYDPNYLNGDGAIFENQTYDLKFNNVKSYDNWDGGLDIKGKNVTITNSQFWGNKNNLKTWGTNIVINNVLSYGARRQKKPDGTTVDGNGINMRRGTVTITNSTFVDNEAVDIKVGTSEASLVIKNTVIARRISSGELLARYGSLTQSNNIWYDSTTSRGSFNVGTGGAWVNPLFLDWLNKNYRFQAASIAIVKKAGYRYP